MQVNDTMAGLQIVAHPMGAVCRLHVTKNLEEHIDAASTHLQMFGVHELHACCRWIAVVITIIEQGRQKEIWDCY